MAVGKSSLGRVAKANVVANVSPEVAACATEEKKVAPVQKAPKVAAAKSKPAQSGKTYAVGDALPVYLL